MGAQANGFLICEHRRVTFALNLHQLSHVKPGETRIGGLTEARDVLLRSHARQTSSGEMRSHASSSAAAVGAARVVVGAGRVVVGAVVGLRPLALYNLLSPAVSDVLSSAAGLGC